MRFASACIFSLSMLTTIDARAVPTTTHTEGYSRGAVHGLSKAQVSETKKIKSGYIKDKDGLLEPIGSPNHFEIIGALGVANLRAGSSVMGVTFDETDSLLQTNKNHWNTFAAQAGLGYIYYFRGITGYSDQVQWLPLIEPQVNVYYLNATPGIKGDVLLFESTASNQLSFTAPVYSTRLMFDTTLTVVARNPFSLYAIGGVGNAWNSMKYSDTNLIDGIPCNDGLSLNSYTRSSFAWEVGGGLTANINNRVAFSVQYLYADLGKARSSANINVGAITTPLTVPPGFNLRAQTVSFGLHVAV